MDGNHTPMLKKSMEGELTEKLHSISYRATKADWLNGLVNVFEKTSVGVRKAAK